MYACTILSDYSLYWRGYSDETSGLAWARQCNLDELNCELLPSDVFKTFFILVKNGFPTLVEDVLILTQYNMVYHYNSNLYRDWVRKETGSQINNFHDFENQGCKSTDYAAKSNGISIISLLSLRLPDAQTVRLTSTLNSIMASTARGTNVEYFNISDSWVDVGLYNHIKLFVKEWRVYGTAPDPWDAPTHIKNAYGSWPPFQFSIKACYHLTTNGPGQQKNGEVIIDQNNVYQTAIPTEKAAWAVQGPWTGRLYQTLSHNVFAHDIISTQFKNLRIEKLPGGGYQIYLSFAGGRIEGYDSSARVQVADANNQWDLNDYYISFQLIGNEILDYSSETGLYPDFINDTVLYDTLLSINKIGNSLFGAQLLENTLSVAGLIEYNNIYTQQAEDFINQGYSPYVIENMPLLKAIGV